MQKQKEYVSNAIRLAVRPVLCQRLSETFLLNMFG